MEGGILLSHVISLDFYIMFIGVLARTLVLLYLGPLISRVSKDTFNDSAFFGLCPFLPFFFFDFVFLLRCDAAYLYPQSHWDSETFLFPP